MVTYHLTHQTLPAIHLEQHKETVLHSSFPLSSCRYSLTLLPESNLRHLECPHADRVPRAPPHDTLVAMIHSLQATRSLQWRPQGLWLSRDLRVYLLWRPKIRRDPKLSSSNISEVYGSQKSQDLLELKVRRFSRRYQ